jgi:thiamine biosynthesis protein ThiS
VWFGPVAALQRDRYRDEPVAVEKNREIVPRAAHAAHRSLRDGDTLEIVTFVGGG